MWYPSFRPLWRSHSTRSAACRTPAAIRLRLELLEDRTVPSTFAAVTVSCLTGRILSSEEDQIVAMQEAVLPPAIRPLLE